MKALTDYIRFESPELGITITIEVIDDVWGFSRSDGYSTWGCVDYKSFNDVYNAAKKSEKNAIAEKILEDKYYNEKS